MVLSTGLGSFPMGWLELGRMGAASGTNCFVADSKGGFWTSREAKSVAKVVGMTAMAGVRGGCKRGRGSARLSRAPNYQGKGWHLVGSRGARASGR